jgi:hypothetical protein
MSKRDLPKSSNVREYTEVLLPTRLDRLTGNLLGHTNVVVRHECLDFSSQADVTRNYEFSRSEYRSHGHRIFFR